MATYLIIQTAFIGDVVLATALIETLHAAEPGAQIDFLLRKGNEPLLEGHPLLREVLVWDKKAHKQQNLFRLVKTIRSRHYDRVINVQRFFATGLMTVLSGARQTFGFDKNPFSRFFTTSVPHLVGGSTEMHETMRNQALIASFTPPADDSNLRLRPKLYPSAAQLLAVRPYTDKPYVTISPASVWFTKQFPVAGWISLLKALPAGWRVLLLGGPGDRGLCESIAGEEPERTLVLAGRLSFLESAALMSGAGMNYVNDSAPMHFASAMNAPVTAVYNSTIPEFGFGPLSDRRFIVQVEEKLYCRPCGLHGYAACPEGHFRCAKDIRTAQFEPTFPAPAF